MDSLDKLIQEQRHFEASYTAETKAPWILMRAFTLQCEMGKYFNQK